MYVTYMTRFIVLLTLCAGMFFLASPLLAEEPLTPEYSFETVMDEKEITNENMQGKVLLVNFWATWCPPCRKEIPTLKKLHEEYGPRGFSVLGISMDEGGSRVVKKFIKRTEINYPVVMGSGSVARQFGGVGGIPVTFVVDRQGKIVSRYDGYVLENEIRQELEKMFQ